MGWLGQVPRALNAVRIYVAPGFNHRLLDIRLFDWFARGRLDEAVGADATVAHVWDSCPALIAALRARGLKVFLDVPIAPLTYGARMRRERGAAFLLDDARLRDIELDAFSRADRLVAPSQFVARELVAAGVDAGRIDVVEFGADLARTPDTLAGPAQAPTARAARGGIDFVFAGNVSRRKGVVELLQAWSDGPFAEDRLHLCGRVFSEIRPALAGARGGSVLTPGFVDIARYLKGCDVFVLPSWLEGSAKSVFEAMAHGLPSIVTDSAGSVVRDGVDGFVIEAGDVDALRSRMAWMRDHPAERLAMGASARARAAGFTWERYAERVVSLYGAGRAPSPSTEQPCA
jgi:glycosyltransferase involved in cell wall biosynthesis